MPDFGSRYNCVKQVGTTLDHLRGALAGEVNCTPKPDAATDLESCQGAVERTATDMIVRRQDPYPRIDPTFAPASSRIDCMLAAIGAAVPKRREMVHEYSRIGQGDLLLEQVAALSTEVVYAVSNARSAVAVAERI